MFMSLKGKRALVCGSTDGIGKSTAILMAKRGAEIILMARNQEKLKNTQNELSVDAGQTHSHICANFNEPDSIEIKLKSELEGPIHILVNNSGGPKGGELIQADLNEFRISFERLLVANQAITQAAVSYMKELNYGRVINIISMSVNQVIPGLGVSNTIRGAVAQWAKTLALELGEFGITVNNILPGYTATNRLNELADSIAKETGAKADELFELWGKNTALKRVGRPEEIASAVAFLASDSASYINGINLSVDGGRFGA